MICKYCNTYVPKKRNQCLHCGASDFYSNNKKRLTEDSVYFGWGMAILITGFMGAFLNMSHGNIVGLVFSSIGVACGSFLVHTHKNPDCKK